METIDLAMKEYEALKQEILEHQKRREHLFIITTTALGVVWGFLFRLVAEGSWLSFGIASFAPYILIAIFCRGVFINSKHIICMGTYIRHFIENKHKESFGWETAWDRFAQTRKDERQSRGYWHTLYLLATIGTCIAALSVGVSYTLSDPLRIQKLDNVVALALFAILHVSISILCVMGFVQKIHWGEMNWKAREHWNKRWEDYKDGNKAITNNKVAGLTPQWAPFHGFSLLFDNSGNSLAPLEESNDFDKIHCNCSQPELELYGALSATLSEIEHELVTDHLFSRLPDYSYHVTVLDGLNDSTVQQILESELTEGRNLLKCLPASFKTRPFLDRIRQDFHLESRGSIMFEFDKLAVWGKNVLVARLRRHDSSEDDFKQLSTKRCRLLGRFKKRHGVKLANPKYTPHVTLGYFANKEFADIDSLKLQRWTKRFMESTSHKTITFDSISLYGFTDMVTFFKPVSAIRPRMNANSRE